MATCGEEVAASRGMFDHPVALQVLLKVLGVTTHPLRHMSTCPPVQRLLRMLMWGLLRELLRGGGGGLLSGRRLL